MKLTQKDFKGMVSVTKQSGIPRNACRDMQNCILEHGLVKTRHGFVKSGSQIYDKVLGMFNYRGALHGHEQLLIFTDNVTRGQTPGDGAVNNPGTGYGGLQVMPSIDIGSDYFDNVDVLWDYQELWDYIRVEVAATNPTWTDAQIDAETDTLTDAEIYTDGAHWTYNPDTDAWEYSGSGNIEQNDIPDAIMPDALKPTLYVTHDATVSEILPDYNDGSAATLVVVSSIDYGNREAYLRVETSVPVTTLNVYLYGLLPRTEGTTITLQVYAVADTWDESTITWNNKPDLGSLLDTVVITSSDINQFTAFDVDGNANVCIKTTSNAYISGISSEFTSNLPYFA